MESSKNDMVCRLFTSRLGRLRYVTYVALLFALLVLPGVLCRKIYGHNSDTPYVMGMAMLYLSVAIYAVLSVRRLHDFGCAAFWALLPVSAYIWLLKEVLSISYTTNGPFFLHFFLNSLIDSAWCGAAIFVLLAAIPGKSAENRFGSLPLPGSLRAKAALVVSIMLSAVWVALPIWSHYHYIQMYKQRMQPRVDDAYVRALVMEGPLRAYFIAHHSWPQMMNNMYGMGIYLPGIPHFGVFKYPFWIYETLDGSLVIDSPYLDHGQIPMGWGNPTDGVAVWTTDHGKTWHCGPYGPLDGLTLPRTCHESPVPPSRFKFFI